MKKRTNQQQAKKIIKQVSVIFVAEDSSVILGKLKKGPGKGFWSTVSGNITSNEDRETTGHPTAAIRVACEQFGLSVEKVQYAGFVTLRFRNALSERITYVFRAQTWNGFPKPHKDIFSEVNYFPVRDIPWELMMPGDAEWLIHALKGRYRIGVDIRCDVTRLEVDHINIGLYKDA
ncbi:MAG: hypothetical protein QOG91_520 [Candidatus Parcubacteria bacterium]|nr:hypothetical protein [Candidatus Parcubacteria bacterium]